MLRLRHIVAGALLLLVAASGWFGYQLVWGKPASVHHLLDRVAIKRLFELPEFLTYLGMVENSALDFHSDRLSDVSPAQMARLAELDERELQILRSYDVEAMDQQEKLSYAFMEWQQGSVVAANRFPYHFDMIATIGPYPANQIDGVQALPVTILTQFQQVPDEDAARRYLDRMAAIPGFLDSLGRAVRARDAMGANPPKVTLDLTIDQVQGLLATAAPDWSLHQTFSEHLAAMDLRQETGRELTERSLAIIENQVIPAYRQLLDTLQDVRGRAPDDVGVWVLPDGEAYYRALLYRYATTRMHPDQIHELGVRLVAELDTRLDSALARLGYVEGDVTSRVMAMMNEPGARYPDSDAGREAIIADFSQIGSELEASTSHLFGRVPDVPVVVARVPEYQQDGEALARYDMPSLDGTRPGRFMINLRSPHQMEKHGMRTLSAHEAVPGHHFETVISQQLEGIPVTRQNAYLASFSEGWALYAERLVYEQGLFDERSTIGYLQSQMFRAVRLVVDTGLHARRWSRQEAIDYMIAHTGMPENDVIGEINRYIAMPGQACSYMLGMQAILEAREDARRRQGERFDLAAFNDAVLANGPLPIEVLKRQLERTLQ